MRQSGGRAPCIRAKSEERNVMNEGDQIIWEARLGCVAVPGAVRVDKGGSFTMKGGQYFRKCLDQFWRRCLCYRKSKVNLEGVAITKTAEVLAALSMPRAAVRLCSKMLMFLKTERTVRAPGSTSAVLTSRPRAAQPQFDCTEEHEWGEGKITKVPSCAEKGERTYICTCGMPRTEEVDKLEHTAAEAVQEKVEPATYDVPGSYEEVVYCAMCGEEISREAHEIERLVRPVTPTPGPAEVEIDEPDVPLAGVLPYLTPAEPEDKLTRAQAIAILHWMDNEPEAEEIINEFFVRLYENV